MAREIKPWPPVYRIPVGEVLPPDYPSMFSVSEERFAWLSEQLEARFASMGLDLQERYTFWVDLERQEFCAVAGDTIPPPSAERYPG